MSDAGIPDLARTHATLRFAFGVTLALIVSELMKWAPTFLAPVFVGVLLVNIPIRPPVKVAVGFIAIITASALIAMLLSTALVGTPLILFGVCVLVVFRSLYGIAEGRSPVAPLLLVICVTTIPVVALQSSAAAAAFAYALVRAAFVAVLVVWISHLLWPHVRPPRPPGPAAPLPPHARLRRALLGTAILTPLMLLYLLFGIADALPVLVATTMIVVNLDFERGRMQAVALVAGNIGGGVAALALILLLAIHRSLISLTLLIALMALTFGWRIAARDKLAPILLVACNATLIVFTSTLLTDKGAVDLWVTRLTQFVVAGAFTIGMMTLLWPAPDATQDLRGSRP